VTSTDAKQTTDGYSDERYWDEYHEIALAKSLDRAIKLETWLDSFRPLLEGLKGEAILDLGCGGGHDAVALSKSGFRLSGCDISGIAVKEATRLAQDRSQDVDFIQHDIATPLPYSDGQFSGVICNLTLHMFPPTIAKRIVNEVRRCLLPGGLFAFHVNATDDLPFRRKLQPPVRALDNGMYCFGLGQTMRFFSKSDCRKLMADWEIALLEPVQMLSPDGEIVKCAWRCAAHRR